MSRQLQFTVRVIVQKARYIEHNIKCYSKDNVFFLDKGVTVFVKNLKFMKWKKIFVL